MNDHPIKKKLLELALRRTVSLANLTTIEAEQCALLNDYAQAIRKYPDGYIVEHRGRQAVVTSVYAMPNGEEIILVYGLNLVVTKEPYDSVSEQNLGAF